MVLQSPLQTVSRLDSATVLWSLCRPTGVRHQWCFKAYCSHAIRVGEPPGWSALLLLIAVSLGSVILRAYCSRLSP